MKKVYRVITLTIHCLFLVKGMVLTEGTEYLNDLLEKSYRYKHYLQNYQTSLNTGLIPNGLKIKKLPAITPVSEDFNTNCNEVLYNAAKNLVELLLYESAKVIAKIQVELDLEVRKIDLKNYDRNYEKLNAKHARFRRGLEKRRGKKWEKVRAHKNLILSRNKT